MHNEINNRSAHLKSLVETCFKIELDNAIDNKCEIVQLHKSGKHYSDLTNIVFDHENYIDVVKFEK